VKYSLKHAVPDLTPDASIYISIYALILCDRFMIIPRFEEAAMLLYCQEVCTMRRAINLFCVLLILLMGTSEAVNAYSMSCAGGVIAPGDRSYDVLAKCGSPNDIESHQEEVILRADADTREKLFITVEEWTYDLGPTQFIRIVTIKNGTVTHIQETHYGAPKP
jgi:hypothetical protein